jgi:hypothetical protein
VLLAEDAVAGGMRQMIACSPYSLSLSCPPDSTISVMNANYGRFSITVCNPQVLKRVANSRLVT